MMTFKRIFSIALMTFCAHILTAQLQVAHVFGDNMVLQREKAVKVWGQASPKEAISVQFNGQTVSGKADKSGKWMVGGAHLWLHIMVRLSRI